MQRLLWLGKSLSGLYVAGYVQDEFLIRNKVAPGPAVINSTPFQNFEPGRSAEVALARKITFWTVRAGYVQE